MPVLVTCPSCGKQTSVSRKLAGKTVRCPGCQGSMAIPAPQAAPPVSQAAYVCSACSGSFPVGDVFDQQGRIVCRSCYAKEAARSATVARTAPSSSIVTCAGCGGTFHQADVQQQTDGSILCAACAAASEIQTITYVSQPSTGVARRKKKSAVPGVLLYAGAIALVITGGVWFAKKYQAQHPGASQTMDQFEVVPVTPRVAPTTAPASRPAELSLEERTYAAAVRDLLTEATRSDQAGDLEGASRKYRDAFELAMKIPPAQRSEALQKELATAQVAWRAVTYKRQSSLNGDGPPAGQNPAVAMSARPSQTIADDSWEASHKKEVADLLDQAEASAGGDKTAAFIKYTELFKYVGQHLSEIKDENLKQRLAKASDMRTQLASAMQIPATGNSPPTETESPASPVRPSKAAVAFAVDRMHLLTAAAPLGGAAKVKMEDPQGNHLSAKVVATDHGLALLEIDPKDVASPGLNYLNLAEKFAAITLRCVSLADDNVFTPTPELIKSNAFAPPRPKEQWFVSFKQHPRLSGAPLINSGNELVGILLFTAKDKASQLPALDQAAIHEFLSAHQALPSEKNPDPDPMAVYLASPEAN